MWLKILGLMMQQQGFRSPQSSLTVDTKAAVNSPTFLTTGPLAAIIAEPTRHYFTNLILRIMKAVTLLISIVLFISCTNNRKRPEPNFYRNLYTNETLNKAEFDTLSRSIIKENVDSITQTPIINYHFYSIEISNDSIIQPFKYDLRIGTEYLVRADKYEKIGMKISPKILLTINDDSIQIGGEQSKPMLINLWFVNCGGCVQEIPALNSLQEKYSDKVNFIAMTFDDAKKVNNFLNNKEFKFDHITDSRKFID
ncbi:MAG: TlpA disulfide reductase family protein, partial [Legionellaceae bacterium]|nr:TlpA disulfide reductase family protein [Legionellaceae bacterium]